MNAPRIIDADGHQATLLAHDADRATIALADGRRFDVPTEVLEKAPGGDYRTSLHLDRLGQAELAEGERALFVEAEEQLRVDGAVRETGRVVVQQRVETHEATLEDSGWQEHVEVERVAVGTFVDAVQPVREQDGVTIVPVYEEVLVVEKRLRLVEEVHLRKTRETGAPQRIALRRTVVDIHREPDQDSDADAT